MTNRARRWIPVLGVLLAALLVAGACSDDDDAPEGAPTNNASASIDATTGATDSPTAAPSPEPCSDPGSCEERSLEIARRDLAAQLRVEVNAIVVVSSEATQWPDACLGVTREGIACAQVITPGFLIVLESGGGEYEYHTNMGTRAVLVQQPSPTG